VSKQHPLHQRNKTVVFDLDGTLADTDDPRGLHKVHHPTFEYEAKNADVFDDMADKLRDLKDDGKKIVILTARSAHYRDVTEDWLHKNDIPYDELVMRPTDNHDKDKIVKRDLMEEDILPHYDVKKAYDDKKKNRKMFEKLGIDSKGVK
jgi:FMN-dependent NADH-azoreductase